MFKALWRSYWGKTPKPGEVYVFDNFGTNPFRAGQCAKVVIKAVRNGWVNYKHCLLIMSQDESMRRRSFLFNYKREEQKEKQS